MLGVRSEDFVGGGDYMLERIVRLQMYDFGVAVHPSELFLGVYSGIFAILATAVSKSIVPWK